MRSSGIVGLKLAVCTVLCFGLPNCGQQGGSKAGPDTARKLFSIVEYTSSRSRLIKEVRLSAKDPLKAYEIERTWNQWQDDSLPEAFWGKLFGDRDIVRVILSLEEGTPYQSGYGTKVIVQAQNGGFLAKSPLFFDKNKATIRYKELDAVQLGNILTALDSLGIDSAQSDLSPYVDDTDVGLLSLALGSDQRQLVIYSCRHTQNAALKHLLQYMDSIFSY